MPDPNVNTPPDTSAWVAARSDADAGVAVETPPPAMPDTAPATEAPPSGTLPADAPPTVSPADELVQGLLKAGMTEEQAKGLVTKATTPQPVKDALEAYLDGKPYPVPKSLTFKLKSGTTVQEKTLEQLQKEGLLYNDYQRSKQDLARERREHAQQVAQWTARDAALKEREKWFEEQRQEMLLAQKDPKKWEEYQEIQRLRQANPAFDKLFVDAMKAREDGAQRGVLEKAQEQAYVADTTEQVVQTIKAMAAEYPGVDTTRVEQLYGWALVNGRLPLTEAGLRQVFEAEASYLKSAASPFEAQMAEMKAKLDALTAAQEAEKHNAGTARALERAKAPNTSPAGGGPAAPVRVTPPKPIPPDRKAIDEAVSNWAKVRE
jgi:hypothetical protein